MTRSIRQGTQHPLSSGSYHVLTTKNFEVLSLVIQMYYVLNYNGLHIVPRAY